MNPIVFIAAFGIFVLAGIIIVRSGVNSENASGRKSGDDDLSESSWALHDEVMNRTDGAYGKGTAYRDYWDYEMTTRDD